MFVKENLTQQEIADKVGASRVSVGRWIKDGKWEELKASLTLTKEEQIQNILRQIAQMNKTIASRKEDEGPRYATTAEADTIGKLSAAVKKLEGEVGIVEVVSVGIKFSEWIRRIDLDKAKEVGMLWDAFVKEMM